MKEMLIRAAEGSEQEKEAAVKRIKELPRTKEGVFDTSCVDGNRYRAGGFVYPLYAAYETKVNKKAGYLDIMLQMRAMGRQLEDEFTEENVSLFLDMLIRTAAGISQEIYENYRELSDLFRLTVRKAAERFGLDAEKTRAGFADADAARVFAGAVEKACGTDVLLAEKYEALAGAARA